MSAWLKASLLLLVSTVAAAFPAAAQDANPAKGSSHPDTARVHALEPVIVTAERSAAPLVTSTAAVSRITSNEIGHLPIRNLADALQQAPGLAFLHFDGVGDDPHLTTRGFYGGGEAEYVAVLLNGQPLNNAEGGLFNWDLIPLAAVQSVEVVRGGASSLYGDAALGGVVNIITKNEHDQSARWDLAGGSFGHFRGSASVETGVGRRDLSLFGALRRTDGFRDHAVRSTGTLGGRLSVLDSEDRAIDLSLLTHWRRFDEPGPLPGSDLGASRSAAMPFYRFDNTDERLDRLSLDGQAKTPGGAAISGYVAGEYRSTDRVRTVLLSPEFADTKRRELANARLLGSAQVEVGVGAFPWDGSLLFGAEGSLGWIDTRYHALFAGGPEDYRSVAHPQGELDARGEATRSAAASFLRYEARPSSGVRLSLGGRLDWIRDRFEARPPSAAEPSRSEHLAFSPRAGLNIRYLESSGHQGHFFASIGRSFKAPTPDQLFDQRTVPVPFPPYAVAFSNAELMPQYGTSVEGGVYHRAELVPGALSGQVTIAAYQMDMRDELDFDLESFRYVNIGRSRHRGVESGVRISGPGVLDGFVNYTLQSVVSRAGEHEGKYLKSVPRHFLRAGASAGHGSGLAASVTTTSAWGIYLDDANTIQLPRYTRLDAGVSYPVRGMRLELEVFNLLDRQYSTTGFPDVAGTGEVFYFPAAGRAIQIGIATHR